MEPKEIIISEKQNLQEQLKNAEPQLLRLLANLKIDSRYEFQSEYDKSVVKAAKHKFKDLRKLLEAATLPAKHNKKMIELAAIEWEALISRYPPKDDHENIVLKITKQDIKDLQIHPPWLVEKACDNWRNQEGNKSDWPPRTVGSLMASVADESRGYVTILNKMDRAEEALKRGN